MSKIEITNEDNMALMARYPDNYFDLAIVDPPYRDSNQPTKDMRNSGSMKSLEGRPQKEYFDEMGYNIIHQDKDFFTYEPDNYDIIVDNAPFSKMKDICIRLKKIDKPFILIAFSRVLLMKWFQKLFKDNLQVIIPFKRPTFTHLTNPKKGYTPPFGVQYYCYKMDLPKDLIFID